MEHGNLEITDDGIREILSNREPPFNEVTDDLITAFRSGWNRGATRGIRLCQRDLLVQEIEEQK